jgi:hypothetical protein
LKSAHEFIIRLLSAVDIEGGLPASSGYASFLQSYSAGCIFAKREPVASRLDGSVLSRQSEITCKQRPIQLFQVLKVALHIVESAFLTESFEDVLLKDTTESGIMASQGMQGKRETCVGLNIGIHVVPARVPDVLN